MISRAGNPNLKDKAGREGIIDNRASKLFREVMINILVKSADQYFGTKSTAREKEITLIKESKAIEKAKADSKKLAGNQRKRIRASLKKETPKLIAHVNIIEAMRRHRKHVASESLEALHACKSEIDTLLEKLSVFL